MRLPTVLLALSFTAVLTSSPALAQSPVTYHYDGDTLPTVGTYGSWFTTVGLGHPSGYYWPTTSWSADGVLRMTTDLGAGIWFGRTDGYSDPSSFNLATTEQGNAVTLRAALAADSTEWSLYWSDASGYGASLYFLSTGFEYASAAGTVHVATDMTAFHTWGTHIADGQVAYTFDGQLLSMSAAYTTSGNFLLLGDGSGSTITGTGTFYVDYLTITTHAGAITAPVPEPGAWAAGLGGVALIAALVRRRDRARDAAARRARHR